MGFFDFLFGKKKTASELPKKVKKATKKPKAPRKKRKYVKKGSYRIEDYIKQYNITLSVNSLRWGVWASEEYRNGHKETLYKEQPVKGMNIAPNNYTGIVYETYLDVWEVTREEYRNGQLKEIASVKDGKFNGIFRMFHQNGQIQYEGKYKNDKQEGLWKLYYENGKLKRENIFKYNEKVSEKNWSENGELKSEEEANKSREKKTTSKSKEDKKSKASESVNLSGDQKMLSVVYPKLKGVDFSEVKFGPSGSSEHKTAAEFFASDIDGSWYYATSQMTMLFKAFSKEKFEKELGKLLDKNGIKFEEKVDKTQLVPEHWKGDGFQIEHPIMEGGDIIMITNENLVPEDSMLLQSTELAPEVSLPNGYENIGIEHIYDGDKFLKANNGHISLNIPLLFKNPENDLHYILIGITTLTLAKKIIDDIIDKNYGKRYFKKLEEKGNWEYMYANKFFTIGFLPKYLCVRINMLHNLVKIGEASEKNN